MEGSADKKRQQTFIAGGVLVVLAIVFFIFIASSGGDDGGGAGGSDIVTAIPCTLATSGVGYIADGLTSNKSAGAIIAGVSAGIAVTAACKAAIDRLVKAPEQPVEFTMTNPDGTTTTEQTTGAELAEPAPSEPTSDFQRAIDCIGWSADFAYDLCVEGVLDPLRR